jgi:hypothetical protein
MQTEIKQVENPTKNKGGRPRGSISPKAQEPKTVTLIEEDGEWLLIRINKKAAVKLLLKDLI